MDEKKQVYIKCWILKGTKGRTYDYTPKFLTKDWKMSKRKSITDYDTAMSLVEYHFPDVIFKDKKIEVEYEITSNKTGRVLYNCVW